MARHGSGGAFRGGRLALLIGSVVIVAVATWLGTPYVERWQTRARGSEALTGLAQCLFGADGQHTEARLRRTVIAAAVLDRAKVGGWPSRCDRFALELQLAVGALENARRSRCSESGCCVGDDTCAALTQLRTALEAGRPALQSGRAEPTVWAAIVPLARSAGLEPNGQSSASQPPAPARLFTPAAMHPLHTQPAELLTDPPGGDQLRLIFHDRQQRYRLCEIDLEGGSVASCRDLPDRLTGGVTGQLLAGAPGAPARLVAPGPPRGGTRWPHTVYDARSGSSLAELTDRPAGGFVWPDGTTAVLTGSNDDDPATLTWASGSDGTHAQVDAPPMPTELAGGPMLLFDELLWAARDSTGALQLYAAHVHRASTAALAPRPLGAAVALSGDIQFEPCVTGQVLSVLVKGEPHGYSTEVVSLFRTNDGWQAPVHATVPSDWFGRTCYDRISSLSWIDAQRELPVEPDSPPGSPIDGIYRISRMRCSAQGCTPSEAEVRLQRHSRTSRYVIGDLGDRMVLLWRSPLGDVRMRAAPLEQLAQAPDVPLFDDEEHGGFDWEQARGAVFARARAAVVVVTAPTASGTAHFGLRIDQNGRATPIDVALP